MLILYESSSSPVIYYLTHTIDGLYFQLTPWGGSTRCQKLSIISKSNEAEGAPHTQIKGPDSGALIVGIQEGVGGGGSSSGEIILHRQFCLPFKVRVYRTFMGMEARFAVRSLFLNFSGGELNK